MKKFVENQEVQNNLMISSETSNKKKMKKFLKNLFIF